MLVLQVLCQDCMVRKDLAAGLAPQLPCSTRQNKLMGLLLRSQARVWLSHSEKRGSPRTTLCPTRMPGSATVASSCLLG